MTRILKHLSRTVFKIILKKKCLSKRNPEEIFFCNNNEGKKNIDGIANVSGVRSSILDISYARRLSPYQLLWHFLNDV